VISGEDGYNGCCGDEPMTDVVDHDAKSLQRSNSKQCHIAGLGKDDFIVGFETLGTENRVTHFPFDLLSGGRRKDSLSSWRDAASTAGVASSSRFGLRATTFTLNMLSRRIPRQRCCEGVRRDLLPLGIMRFRSGPVTFFLLPLAIRTVLHRF
jgi:hypothetical protein